MNENPARDIPHYLRIFQRYLGNRIYWVLILTLIASLSEGFGIILLLPLLQEVDSFSGAAVLVAAEPSPAALNSVSDPASGISAFVNALLVTLGLADSIVALLALITIAFILKGLFTFGALAYIAYLRGMLLRELKGRLYGHYSRMSYSYYASRDTGHFINVINAQANSMIAAFNGLAQLLGQVVTTLIYLTLALLVAWKFGLMALLVGVSILGSFRWLNSYTRQLSRMTASENGHLGKLIIQSLHAFKYLVATGQGPQLKHAIERSIARLTGYEIRTGVAQSFTAAIREPVIVVLIMCIVLFQVVYLQAPLAPILVSILLFYRGLNAALGIQGRWQMTLNVIGGVEMVDLEFREQNKHAEPEGNKLLKPLSEGIRLANVHFAYKKDAGDIIDGMSLFIPARTSVAFVGQSGAGKSTLADIFTLILKPRSGKILIDGIEGDQVKLDSWRRQIGYVSQEAAIFDDTIANNISMWVADSEYDGSLEEHVQVAAEQANIAEYIESLPDGYQTWVGDRGLRLSGGQRQRLCIARELFRKPQLLILDEATSALDSESEQAIQKSIDALKGSITVVMIAHRLSTIRNVDQVYVVRQGRIVEQGSFQELRDTEGSQFHKLATIQSI